MERFVLSETDYDKFASPVIIKLPGEADSSKLNDVRHYPIDFSRLLAVQYMALDTTIRHADMKAQLILGMDAILITAATNTSFLQLLDTFASTWQRGGSAVQAGQLGVLACLMMSVAFALMTIFPRFRRSPISGQRYFFRQIADMSEEDFVEHYMHATMDEVKASVIAQIHAKSSIANCKFSHIRRSIFFLALALSLWSAMYVLVI